jgi:hypothetical protein
VTHREPATAVTLTVTDSQGRQGTVSRTVLVGSQYAAAC